TREYDIMIERLKYAITVFPKNLISYEMYRLINLIMCADILGKAVGTERFREDAREIFPVMCEAYEILFRRKDLRHLSIEFVDNFLFARCSKLLNLFSSMAMHVDENPVHE
ncbi:hypothetical protein PMAYCL1PPCAC_28138, partial [Pristionchus mayeri]